MKVTLSPSRDVIVITPFFGKWKSLPKEIPGESLVEAVGASLRLRLGDDLGLLLGDILREEPALELRAFA